MLMDFSILYQFQFSAPRIKSIIKDIHPDVNSKVFHKDIEGLTSNDVEY